MLPTVFVFVQEFVSFCICVAVINTLSGGSKKLSETQLTSRGNKIGQRKQGKIGRREEIGSQSKQIEFDNNIQKKEPVQNGSWPLIDSHLLSGYNLCWNHFEKLYLDLILHIVKPYI